MNVITTRNVHSVLPIALRTLFTEGVQRDSRNGPVLQYPTPVTTVYQKPLERVVFHPERDANPFFHLYESLWMLAGRNDVAGPKRYAVNMANYSDDGATFHGAYGHRWRRHFQRVDEFAKLPGVIYTGNPADLWHTVDQLKVIAEALRADHTDRRCMLQMWDAVADLGKSGKDFPCNTMATFQVNTEGALDLSLFCRSNDIVWGAYGANAVHFGFLLEYMAHWIGVPVGRFYQISVNWHGYLSVLEKVRPLAEVSSRKLHQTLCPYGEFQVRPLSLVSADVSIEELDHRIAYLLFHADHGFPPSFDGGFNDDQPFFGMAYRVLRAHKTYKMMLPHEGRAAAVESALAELDLADGGVDWVVAARQWIERRSHDRA